MMKLGPCFSAGTKLTSSGSSTSLSNLELLEKAWDILQSADAGEDFLNKTVIRELRSIINKTGLYEMKKFPHSRGSCGVKRQPVGIAEDLCPLDLCQKINI